MRTTRLSIAQTLVWLDPAAALAALDRLEPVIHAVNPANLSKLKLTRSRALRALGHRRTWA